MTRWAAGLLGMLLAGTPAAAEPMPAGPAAAAPVSSELTYDADGLRDPMQHLLPTKPPAPPPGSTAATEPAPPPPVEPDPPTVTVEGILWGGRFPQAIINGDVYDVGDTVDGSTIVAIDRAGVTVDNSGTWFVISPSVGSSHVRQVARRGPRAGTGAGQP